MEEGGMATGSTSLRVVFFLAAALLTPASAPHAQGSACAAPDKRQACSFQCCGRRSCPPSCEIDCVKACVDSCASAAGRAVYEKNSQAMQIRCGKRNVTGALGN